MLNLPWLTRYSLPINETLIAPTDHLGRIPSPNLRLVSPIVHYVGSRVDIEAFAGSGAVSA